MTTQIKSKKRVRDHGEVFTPPALVNDMLDMIRDETYRIDALVLEPACGTGNFMVEILLRKLISVERLVKPQNYLRRELALIAVTSLYGVDILADNVAECRAALLEVFAALIPPCDREAHRWAAHIVEQNVQQGDFLTGLNSAGAEITFTKWHDGMPVSWHTLNELKGPPTETKKKPRRKAAPQPPTP